VKSIILTGYALFLFVPSGRSQDAAIDHHPFAIGEINYFGYGGLPLEKIRAALPWHVGDKLSFATFSRKPVADAISSVIGKPPTDVNIVCCDPSRRLEIFIGLPGSTSRSVPTAPAPSGNIHLDPEGLRLYNQGQPLMMKISCQAPPPKNTPQLPPNQPHPFARRCNKSPSIPVYLY